MRTMKMLIFSLQVDTYKGMSAGQCSHNVRYRHQTTDTNKIGKFTYYVTLWPVRNFAVPNARNFGEIFITSIRSEITDRYKNVSMETQSCVLCCVFQLFKPLLEMQAGGSFM